MEQTFKDKLHQDLHQFLLMLTEVMVGECASRVYFTFNIHHQQITII